MSAPPAFDDRAAADLARDLAAEIEGDVRFDPGGRALYATDASNYRQPPIGVVVPRSVEDVVAAVALCRRHGAPVLARGGGTSLAGQCCNAAVIIDMSRHLRRIREIDADRRAAWVEPGCVLDDLRGAAEKHHLTFGPDPSTHDHNTLGGMIGNNSCGVHSVMAGRTVDNVISLDVLTYDGQRMNVGATDDAAFRRVIEGGGRKAEIYRGLRELRDAHGDEIRRRYPKIPRRVSGYSLDALLPENGFQVAQSLVGHEGTCVVVLGAELRLVPSPPARVLTVIGFNDVFAAADAVPRLLEYGPIGLEGMDEILVEDMRRRSLHTEFLPLLPQGRGWLIAEFGADRSEDAERQARRLEAEFARHGADTRVVVDKQQQLGIWKVRKAGLGATADVPGEAKAWEGWEDAAVPPERLGSYLRDFDRLLGRFGYRSSLYGHFGDGCIHCRINFDLATKDGIEKYRAFTDAAADLVLGCGGSFSGEHGDGQSRGELLPKMFGPELIEAFRRFKSLWDPDWKLNPGKKIDPYRRDENLRLGTSYRPPPLRTAFAYREDEHNFGHAMLRCVGVGECRRREGGVMCPSYRATLDETHSTRGRARLLFEMVNGGILKGGWREAAVHDALDLCLACKGCKHDCPVNVDMATYKAEFNFHYYARRLRPRAAYSMGLIPWWARIASQAPGLANFALQAPGLSHLARLAGGISLRRRLPRFAHQTFRDWFQKRPLARQDGKPVVLFADTFNNYFYPQTAIAAVEVLEAAGYRVIVPNANLCCGRPLYAWGMIGTARKMAARIIETLGETVNQGVPVVGIEPACMSTFRDELPKLFPQDANADRLVKQSHMLSEFLGSDDDYRPPRLDRPIQAHFHCHHHAVFNERLSKKFFDKLSREVVMMDAGCCGMAGSFGFEANHYEVAMKAGEQEVLPQIRDAPEDRLIVTNGFSCREQIRQATGRAPLHFAELARLALRDGADAHEAADEPLAAQ
jgi:FAD/FMN-containing dehydrogenase/Fe-S oxidoreductase